MLEPYCSCCHPWFSIDANVEDKQRTENMVRIRNGSTECANISLKRFVRIKVLNEIAINCLSFGNNSAESKYIMDYLH